MSGDPAQSQRPSRPPKQSPAFHEWYAVTGGGASALRIAPGLVVGESDSGALALNDAEPANQWVEFVVNESGEPWATIITREKSLRVHGASRMRHQLGIGTVVQLPHNTLHISRDKRLPAASGQVIEVVDREVPGHPQDLVGPGWAEALAAVREPSRASRAPERGETPGAGEPTRARRVDDDTEREWVPPRAPDPDFDEITRVAEPRPSMQSDPRRRTRRPQWGRRAAVMLLALGVGTVTVGGILVVLLSAGPGSSQRAADPDVSGFEEPDLGVPPDGLPADRPEDPAEAPAARQDEAIAGPPGTDATVVEPWERPANEAVPPPAIAEEDMPADELAEEAEAPGERLAEPAPQRAAGETAATEIPREADRATSSSPPAEAASPEVPVTGASDEPVRETRAEEVVREESRQTSPPPDWRLVRAGELLDAGYITYPPRDNAVAYLERLLAEQPNHRDALALLEQCTDELIDAALRAHDQGLEYEARNTLEEVLGFDPDNAQANRLWREWVDVAR